IYREPGERSPNGTNTSINSNSPQPPSEDHLVERQRHAVGSFDLAASVNHATQTSFNEIRSPSKFRGESTLRPEMV
ncbi:hypothetical protein, partial [Actinoplanes couchii]|uniref:hypothetical protein n=1 Tax=Actinoplanes couchii TaxID=403638 RepID=UPI0031D80811